MTHRLTLASPARARAYLEERGRRAWVMSQGAGNLRKTLLKDRAAMFWICHEARLETGPHRAWVVLAPREDPLPRIHSADGPGLGDPLHHHQPLREAIAFGCRSLAEHGALWMPWPMEANGINKTFGEGAWKAIQEARAHEEALRLNLTLKDPSSPMATRRL